MEENAIKELTILDVPLSLLKQDYVRIENLKQYLFNIEQINPLDREKYLSYWATIKKYCVEGFWGEESGGFRYMTNDLFFYGNLFTIQDTDDAKNTIHMRPFVRDIDWELSYGILVAEGFSGFYEDDEYTCDELALSYERAGIPKNIPDTFRNKCIFRKDGRLKTYEKPIDYIRRLHKKKMGAPLYFNEAGNNSILGSRGGGKSYFISGKATRMICVDNIKYYDDKTRRPYLLPDYKEEYFNPIVEIMVGSGNTSKSSEFIGKIETAMNELAVNNSLGVWGAPEETTYEPCPLFKQMKGSLEPNNKKDPWIHSYEVTKEGRKVTKGSQSKLYHVSYFEQKAKGKGAQEGAGGRVALSVIEESGLTSNSIQVHNSNTFVVSRNGIQFGIQVDIGTSGNIEAIQETRKKWSNPKDYRIVSYLDLESQTETGFFLPFYLTINSCKDQDGNTIYEKAFEIVRKRREIAAAASDPSVLREEKMNAPIIPSEMWTNTKGYRLPYDEAVLNQKRLVYKSHYLDITTPVKLVWNKDYPNGVMAMPDYEKEPFYNFPIESSRSSREGPVIIYEEPILIDGVIPENAYFFVYDMYVSDNIDDGGSLGCTFVVLDPLYWEDYLTDRGPIVASYIGKHPNGLDGYHEVQEKLIAYYGNPEYSMFFEKERGRSCRDYYIKRNKGWCLALTPNTYDSASAVAKRQVAEYGIYVGNKSKKIRMLDETTDWLKQDVKVKNINGEIDVLQVIHTLSCKFTTEQIIDFDLDKAENYDSISALIMIPTAIKEREYYVTEKFTSKNKHNPLAFLSKNSRLFKN